MSNYKPHHPNNQAGGAFVVGEAGDMSADTTPPPAAPGIAVDARADAGGAFVASESGLAMAESAPAASPPAPVLDKANPGAVVVDPDTGERLLPAEWEARRRARAQTAAKASATPAKADKPKSKRKPAGKSKAGARSTKASQPASKTQADPGAKE